MKIMDSKAVKILLKYKEVISYLFFGGVTTAVNWIVYIICVKLFQIDMTLGNAIAWIIAVATAYITNKLFVFESKAHTVGEIAREVVSFLGARVATGIIEIVFPTLLFKLGLKFTVFGIQGFGAKVIVSVAVIILNYVLSKLWIFKDNKNKSPRSSKNLTVYLASFLLPAAVITAVFFALGITPFGNYSAAAEDANIQYLDLFQYFRNVLKSEDSFVYSFNHFLGSTAIATFAYYLSSPFNLLILLFKKGDESLFLSLLILLKISLSGLTCSVYLKNRFEKLSPLFTVILSSGYALMHYSKDQSSNVMWLDGVYLLPLMLLGAYQIVIKGHSGLFVASLFISIASNWYSGYFNCIAVAVYFFFELLVMNYGRTDRKEKFNRFIALAWRSAVGVGLSGIIFIPAILALNDGKGQLSLLIDNSFNANILNVFQGFAAGNIGWTSSMLFLFCGSFAFLGAALYFADRGRTPRERFGSAAAALFMILLAYYRPLEFIADGFRNAGSYSYRFAYIITFYVIFFAASFYQKEPDKKPLKYIYAACVCALLMILSNFIDGSVVSLTKIAETSAVLLLISLIVSKIVLTAKDRTGKRNFKLLLSVLLVGTVSLELFFNGYFILKTRIAATDVKVYKEYVNTHTELANQLKGYDSSFYRTAQTEYRFQNKDTHITANYNDPLAYGFKGISFYTSTYDNKQAELMQNLGYSSIPEIAINNTRILSSDSLLGTKYILSSDTINGLEEVKELKEIDGIKTYLNPFALNNAVVYPDSDLKADFNGDPFEYQNQLFSQLAGKKVSVFKKLDSAGVKTDKGMVYTAPGCNKDEIIYFYAESDYYLDTNVYANGKLISKYLCWLSPKSLMLPFSTEKTEVLFENTGENLKNVTFYKLDLSLLGEISSELNSNSADKSDIQNGHAAFSVNGTAGSRLLIQIPEERGWTVTLNGKPAKDVQKFADCLYSIGLEDGECEIELDYTLPGAKLGIIISAASLTLAAAAGFIRILKKRKTQIRPL